MAAVLLHLLAMENAETTEEPGEDGNFEDDAHSEGEKHQGVDVTLEGDEVLDGGVHLVVGQESEGDGEEDEVAEEDARHEHEVGGDDKWRGITSLVFV